MYRLTVYDVDKIVAALVKQKIRSFAVSRIGGKAY